MEDVFGSRIGGVVGGKGRGGGVSPLSAGGKHAHQSGDWLGAVARAWGKNGDEEKEEKKEEDGDETEKKEEDEDEEEKKEDDETEKKEEDGYEDEEEEEKKEVDGYEEKEEGRNVGQVWCWFIERADEKDR
ncbi:hypothetical protein Pmani_037712 [Petrolisthes manimaculis]|uniref:Uncharacterized protein n=1 Tax=Petrolisthes manimaculis TaxID=1843537 RepID=A0AAE1NHR5_9EUCA|nr:hypothetical protein Pmani_037712 [Petrolisthes manimaculis]